MPGLRRHWPLGAALRTLGMLERGEAGELTASELRVARMAADGMTNREIAQTLFVTARTVEGHLTNVVRKLDIRSRSLLARTLDPG